ncbi:chitooligosaccharide deacetylase, partial [Lacticaseibacillus rhamnosus]
CHPGYVDADLHEHSSFTTGRTYTLRELIKPELKARLADEGVKLGTYRDLVTQDQPLEEEPV